jgi:hypothetical protein
VAIRLLNDLVEWFLPPALRAGDPDIRRRAKLCIAYNLAVPVWAPGFAALLWAIDQPLIAAIILGASLLTPAPLLLLRSTGSLTLTGFIAAVMSVTTGGLHVAGGAGSAPRACSGSPRSDVGDADVGRPTGIVDRRAGQGAAPGSTSPTRRGIARPG